MKREERGPLYLLTGLLIGIILGFAYARYFQPVKYVDTSPDLLRSDFKDQYRALIAAAYVANGDLVRARARLELLKDPDVFRALTEQAQQTLAQNGSSSEARALGLLAIALGQAPPGPGQAITQAQPLPTGTRLLSTPANMSSPTQSVSASTPSSAAVSQLTQEPLFPSPTAPAETIPTLTIPTSSFVLLSKTEVCDQALPEPTIQVDVSDQSGQPVQGTLVIVTWAGGEDRFYTGLKPEMGLGYADYTLDPNFVYSLRLGENGAPLGNLGAVTCTNDEGGTFWGALQLKFGQP